jgi:hypothetical protein
MLLVGGLKFGFDFPFQIWDVILPWTNSINFQDGYCTTKLIVPAFQP